MTNKDDLDKLIGIVFGILGGIALAELLKKLLEKRCPYCTNINESNRKYCKFCGGRLQ